MSSFEERLPAASTDWVSEGIITPEQRGRLLARHPISAHGTNRFVAIFATIGGVLLVVGVSLLIKSHWEWIGDWTKIIGLLVILVGAYAAGWRLKLDPGRYPRVGDACLMVGAVCFFLGIVLVSQIFHLNSRPANGVLLWWLGIAAVPWLTRAHGTLLVSVAAWFIWLMMELNSDDSWIRLIAHPNGIVDTGLLMSAAAFLLGVFLFLFGVGLGKGRDDCFAELLQFLGLAVASVTLYIIGFSWSEQNWYWRAQTPASLPAIGALLGLVAAAALVAWRNRTDIKGLGWYVLLGFVPALALLFGVDLHDSSWLWGGFACVAMFLLNVGMIRFGVATGAETWINVGIAGIALNIITRYFLLFGTMLEGGIFFIATGLVVLGLGYYLERKRRSLVRTVRQEAHP